MQTRGKGGEWTVKRPDLHCETKLRKTNCLEEGDRKLFRQNITLYSM